MLDNYALDPARGDLFQAGYNRAIESADFAKQNYIAMLERDKKMPGLRKELWIEFTKDYTAYLTAYLKKNIGL